MRIAIVGAGVAGLTGALALRDAGCEVVVFDKGRGPGGRTATRRAGALSFDHGAPVVAPGTFGELCGGALRPPSHLAAHRWRHAVPRTRPAGLPPAEGGIAVAGDWCLGRDAAAAVRSGRAAAELLLA